MAGTLEKVMVFVTRRRGDADELLVFEHPFAGTQLPAGTVEPGEAPVAAALRYAGSTADRWEVATDRHQFRLFWAPLTRLPTLAQPQDRWLTMLSQPLGREARGPADERG